MPRTKRKVRLLTAEEMDKIPQEGDVKKMNDKVKPPAATPVADILVAFMEIPSLTIGNAAVVSQSLAKRDDLASSQTVRFTAEINPERGEQFTPDIPNVPEDDLQYLDKTGLVISGAPVKQGDILIGRVSPKKEVEMSAEDRLMERIFGEKAAAFKDTSVRMPYPESGRCRVAYAGFSEDGRTAVVDVLIERPLVVGDLLEDGHGNTIVVAAILPDEKMPFLEQYQKKPEMILKPLYPGTVDCATIGFKRTGQLLKDKIHARHSGWLNQISGVPITDQSGWHSGASISEHDLRVFVSGNCLNIAAELMFGYEPVRLYETIVRGEELPELRMPEPIKVLFLCLRAMGWKIDLSEKELKISIASTEDIRSWSWGEVKRDGFIDGRSLKPFSDGLFSEQIFGPLADWHCACGKYNRVRFKGIICEKCGVELARAKVRREKMGHIALAAPMPHPFCRTKKLEALPVLPAGLRPIITADSAEKQIYELNACYRAVIRRNNHLAKIMLKKDAPECILENEKRMVYEAIVELFSHLQGFHNFSGGSAIIGLAQHVYESFWQNRMVDFSGQGVLVPDPSLAIDQCALPKQMAMEILRPMVISQLVENDSAHNVKSAKRIIHRAKPEAFEALTEVALGRLLLVYYRTNKTTPASKMYSFQVVLTDDDAIKLSPETCRRFGAKLQGEKVDVILPLSPKSQKEAENFLPRAIDFPCCDFPSSDKLPPVQSALFLGNQRIEDVVAELQKSENNKIVLPLSDLDKLLLWSFLSSELPPDDEEDILPKMPGLEI